MKSLLAAPLKTLQLSSLFSSEEGPFSNQGLRKDWHHRRCSRGPSPHTEHRQLFARFQVPNLFYISSSELWPLTPHPAIPYVSHLVNSVSGGSLEGGSQSKLSPFLNGKAHEKLQG